MKIPDHVKVSREDVDRNYPIALRESKLVGGDDPNQPKEFYKYNIKPTAPSKSPKKGK